MQKVEGKMNIADSLTKHVQAGDIRVHMHRTKQGYCAGRHRLAPEIAQ